MLPVVFLASVLQKGFSSYVPYDFPESAYLWHLETMEGWAGMLTKGQAFLVAPRDPECAEDCSEEDHLLTALSRKLRKSPGRYETRTLDVSAIPELEKLMGFSCDFPKSERCSLKVVWPEELEFVNEGMDGFSEAASLKVSSVSMLRKLSDSGTSFELDFEKIEMEAVEYLEHPSIQALEELSQHEGCISPILDSSRGLSALLIENNRTSPGSLQIRTKFVEIARRFRGKIPFYYQPQMLASTKAEGRVPQFQKTCPDALTVDMAGAGNGPSLCFVDRSNTSGLLEGSKSICRNLALSSDATLERWGWRLLLGRVTEHSFESSDVYEKVLAGGNADDQSGEPLEVRGMVSLWLNKSDEESLGSPAMKNLRSLFRDVAGIFWKKYIFVEMGEGYAYEMRSLGEAEPFVLPYLGFFSSLDILKKDKAEKYVLPGEVNLTNLAADKPKVLKKKLIRWLKQEIPGKKLPLARESAKIPDEQTEPFGIVEVVWKTWEKYLSPLTSLSSSSNLFPDVLLEVYWKRRERNRQSLASLYAVARALELVSAEGTRVARYEASSNYLPEQFKCEGEATKYFVLRSGSGGAHRPVECKVKGAVASPEVLLRCLHKNRVAAIFHLEDSVGLAKDLGSEWMDRGRRSDEMERRQQDERRALVQEIVGKVQEKNKVDGSKLVEMSQLMGAEIPDKVSEKVFHPEKGQPMERRVKERKTKKKDSESLPKNSVTEKGTKDDSQKTQARYNSKSSAETKMESAGKSASPPPVPSVPPLKVSLKWWQSNEALFLEARGGIIRVLNASHVNLTPGGNTSVGSWSLELRDDVETEDIKEKQSDVQVLKLLKSRPHRWDRALEEPPSAIRQLPGSVDGKPAVLDLFHDLRKDFEDLAEAEDPIEIPSGRGISSLSSMTAGLKSFLLGSADSTAEFPEKAIILALRFPFQKWCLERDRVFMEAARRMKHKEDAEFRNWVTFVSGDALSKAGKSLAREFRLDGGESCPWLLFKTDEGRNPYILAQDPKKPPPIWEELQVEIYKRLLPVVAEVKSRAKLESLLEVFDTTVVGWLPTQQGGGNRDAWRGLLWEAARMLRGKACFAVIERNATSNVSLAPELPSEIVSSFNASVSSVWVFKRTQQENRTVEIPPRLLEEEDSLAGLQNFIEAISLPLLGQYGVDTVRNLKGSKVPQCLLFLEGSASVWNSEKGRRWRNVLRRVGHVVSGRATMMVVNASRDGLFMRPFGFDPRPEALPHFGVQFGEGLDSKKFAFSPPSSEFWEISATGKDDAVNRLSEFIKSVLEGHEEEAHETGHLHPEYQYAKGHVHEVTFNSITSSLYNPSPASLDPWGQPIPSDPERNVSIVLLELYHPQRSRHGTLSAVMDALAWVLVDVRGLKLARMDLEANYIPDSLCDQCHSLGQGKGVGGMGLMGGLSSPEDSGQPTTVYSLYSVPLQRSLATYSGPKGKILLLPQRLLSWLGDYVDAVRANSSQLLEKVDVDVKQRLKEFRAAEREAEEAQLEDWLAHERSEFERLKGEGKLEGMAWPDDMGEKLRSEAIHS